MTAPPLFASARAGVIFFVARLRAAVLWAGDEALLAVFFFAFATGAREALPVAFFAALRW